MVKKTEVPLKIELFADGEDSQFSIHSKREILSILRGVAQENSRVALYYDEGNGFLLTTILRVNEQGLWLGSGSIEKSNRRILHSHKIIFISSRHQVKVQFVAKRIENALLGECAAFHLPLPDHLLRIQRREYFRLTSPVSTYLKCLIPVLPPVTDAAVGTQLPKREVTILDISGGGIALVCEAHDIELLPGKAYPDCRIPLPDVGSISATIKVKNSFEITLRNGKVSKRVGCEFTHLSGEAMTLLQRYIVLLQAELLAKV